MTIDTKRIDAYIQKRNLRNLMVAQLIALVQEAVPYEGDDKRTQEQCVARDNEFGGIEHLYERYPEVSQAICDSVGLATPVDLVFHPADYTKLTDVCVTLAKLLAEVATVTVVQREEAITQLVNRLVSGHDLTVPINRDFKLLPLQLREVAIDLLLSVIRDHLKALGAAGSPERDRLENLRTLVDRTANAANGTSVFAAIMIYATIAIQ